MIRCIITASLIFGAIPLSLAMLGAAVLAYFQRRTPPLSEAAKDH